jgi:hypothetical protein
MSKKIMFNDKFGLTQAVLDGRKTMTRRVVKGEIPLGNWEETEKYAIYHVGEVVAIAQSYRDVYLNSSSIYKIGLLGRTAGWRNKMYVSADDMPHQIKITNIRVERLQDISDEDCLREGVVKNTIGYFVEGLKCKDWEKESHVEMENGETLKLFPTPREAFAALIDKVSGRGTWESNPMVWVYKFELVD